MTRTMNCTRSSVRAASAIGGTLLAASALGAAVHAGPTLDLSWYSVDGGGGTSVAGDLVLAGVIGQPDTGVSIGGDLVLVGGFLASASAPSIPPCPPDVNGDQSIDFDDVLAVLAAYGACGGGPCPADLDGSGAVDFSDLLAVLSAFGPCPG